MTKRELKFFGYARNMSQLSDFKRIHIGCVIVDGGRVVSSGFNTTKTHPLQKRFNRFRFPPDDHVHNGMLHAEMSALIPLLESGEDLGHSKMFISRYDGEKRGLCRPCAAWMEAIRRSGLRTVYYTTTDGMVREDLN